MARNMVRLRTSMYWILKISHFFQGIPTESKMGSSPHPVAGVVSWGDPMRVAEMLDVQETLAGSGDLWRTSASSWFIDVSLSHGKWPIEIDGLPTNSMVIF